MPTRSGGGGAAALAGGLQSRALNVVLVAGDCFFIGMQPILVYMSKARSARPSVKAAFTPRAIWKSAKANVLLAVPALLYAMNNYLKFVMQLYFKPTTVKMLGNLKILVIAVLLTVVMKRRFTFMQCEALVLLLIGISINQIPCGGNAAAAAMLDVSPLAWVYTFFFLTIPSTASVYNEYALKSQFDTSVHLQNFFMYCWGLLFNLIFLLGVFIARGGDMASLNILQGHSRATAVLIANNAMQGILSSFFFKYADTILKKYSSTIATIFTGIASAILFGHTLSINFALGVSVVLISMHQFFSAMPPKAPRHKDNDSDVEDWEGGDGRVGGSKGAGGMHVNGSPAYHSLSPRSMLARESSLVEMAAGANEEANHRHRLTAHALPI
ncbi:unnamed protein product [Closterium sp. Yama58-4]|nr:unnamed protein product [Closterium sp. Yama58-4]